MARVRWRYCRAHQTGGAGLVKSHVLEGILLSVSATAFVPIVGLFSAWRRHGCRPGWANTHTMAEHKWHQQSGNRPRPHRAAFCMACFAWHAGQLRLPQAAGCFGLDKAPAGWLPNGSTDVCAINAAPGINAGPNTAARRAPVNRGRAWRHAHRGNRSDTSRLHGTKTG